MAARSSGNASTPIDRNRACAATLRTATDSWTFLSPSGIRSSLSNCASNDVSAAAAMMLHPMASRAIPRMTSPPRISSGANLHQNRPATRTGQRTVPCLGSTIELTFTWFETGRFALTDGREFPVRALIVGKSQFPSRPRTGRNQNRLNHSNWHGRLDPDRSCIVCVSQFG